jgi:hypothetical protein
MDTVGAYQTTCMFNVIDVFITFITSSSGERDEVATAAAWMYKATNDNGYLTDAQSLYPAGTPWGFAWNDAQSGAAVCYIVF